MKIGILTFHFAHNYGAVLQAYALKTYLNSLGKQAEIIDFVPCNLENEYSLNPFVKRVSFKYKIKSMLRMPKRIRQYVLFENFINKELVEINGAHNYSEVLFGSDQIWNENITGKIDTYYGSEIDKNVRRIAYAASFGSSKLSDFQKCRVEKYLPAFDAIALRESDVIAEVEKLANKQVVSVLDPVFLLDKEVWDGFAHKSKHKENNNYILYYALRYDPRLIAETENQAKALKCKVVCIHPTCNDLCTNWKQSYDIGPYEFVELVKNAELVATNSFHAMAFSVIFEKKALYKAYSETESRVPSLLSICSVDADISNPVIYNFNEINRDNLVNAIESSKGYLRQNLEER